MARRRGEQVAPEFMLFVRAIDPCSGHRNIVPLPLGQILSRTPSFPIQHCRKGSSCGVIKVLQDSQLCGYH